MFFLTLIMIGFEVLLCANYEHNISKNKRIADNDIKTITTGLGRLDHHYNADALIG